MRERTNFRERAWATDESDGSAAPKEGNAGEPALAPYVLYPSWAEWNSPVSAEQEARRLFCRTLSAWAMDALALRRRGLDVPRSLRRSMGLAPPARSSRG